MANLTWSDAVTRLKTTISATTWQRLVDLNLEQARTGSVREGVFATGIGPDYHLGDGLLYIGKSAGPLGDRVGSCADQALSSAASATWMIAKRNLSAFWQFVDQIDPSRRSVAWTNVAKMDAPSGKRPSGMTWVQMADASIAALHDEIETLAPKVIVFAISTDYLIDVQGLLADRGYIREPSEFADGWTTVYRHSGSQCAVTTRHPQGWPRTMRDPVISCVKQLLAA